MRQTKQFYEFEDFRLDLINKALTRSSGETVPITRKMFETLLALVENADRLVEKDALMQRIWHDRFVEESNLTFNIKMLRKTLGDDAARPRFIETVPRRGYRFIAPVRLVEEKDAIEKIVLEKGISEPPPVTVAEKTGKKYLAAAVLAIFLLAILGFTYYYNNHRRKRASESFAQINTNRVTSTGKAFYSIISPDGKYVIYAAGDGEKQSLWIRQFNETRDIEIVPATTGQIGGLSVSPDSKSVYYTLWQDNRTDAVLYQVPILGGTSRQVISNIDSGISFSSDGSEFAFYRTAPGKGLSQLLIAAADGTRQRVVTERYFPETFETEFGDPLWKPSERKILAIAASNAYEVKSNVVEIDIETGAVKPFVEAHWAEIHQIAWLKASRSLLLVAPDDVTRVRQIWHIDPARGAYRKVTDDLNDYRGISLTDDEKILVTTRTEQITKLRKTNDPANGNADEILSETGKPEGDEGLAWTPDNRLVFSLGPFEADNISILDEQGIRPLTVDVNGNRQPTVCGRGQFIVYAANFVSPRLWKMDTDGKNAQLLTKDGDGGGLYPHCSANSDWVVYQKGLDYSTLWKVPVSGGASVQLTDSMSFQPNVSPDGKQVAYYYLEKNKWGIGIVSIEDGSLLKKVPISTIGKLRHLRWTPDGKNLAYSDTRGGVSNIWLQSTDGSAPTRLTHFDAGMIYYFDWSPDGKNFAFAQGFVSSDVVSISDVR